jgi:hypothetical protein
MNQTPNCPIGKCGNLPKAKRMKTKITEKDLQDGIKRVANATQHSSEELNKLAETISQAGISFKQLLEIHRKAMDCLPVYEGNFEKEIILPQEDFQESLGAANHPFLCRWWLRTRPCQLRIQIDKEVPACIEFYVPWWGWPFELTHRLIFGSTKIK